MAKITLQKKSIETVGEIQLFCVFLLIFPLQEHVFVALKALRMLIPVPPSVLPLLDRIME
jgi:hypothetical protein